MAFAWPEIFDSFKFILTGIGGYLVRFFQSETRKRRMRRQLYREISRNNQNIVVRIAMCSSVAGIAQGAPLRFSERLDISFDVWNFYNDERRREFLFELREADAINRIYDKVNRIGMDLPGYQHVRGKEAAAEVDDRLLDGSLNRKLYQRMSTKEAWAFMADLITGKRESYRKYLSPL
jgi:hypothetical protein